MLGFWSLTRDQPCTHGEDTSVKQPTCHSLTGGDLVAQSASAPRCRSSPRRELSQAATARVAACPGSG